MYLAMSRQADREGYPEIAEAFKRYAFEEAEHAQIDKLTNELEDAKYRALSSSSDLTQQTRESKVLERHSVHESR